jgi:hypothetical protein
LRLRRAHVLAPRESPGEEVLVDGLGDLVLLEARAPDELGLDAVGLVLEQHPGREGHEGQDPARRAGVLVGGSRVADHGHEPVALALAQDVGARLCAAAPDRHGASDLLSPAGTGDVLGDGLAIIVEGRLGA